MVARWFKFGKVSFVIRPPDPGVILFLNEKRKKKELTGEEMQKEIFSFPLLKWEGITGGETFPRTKQMDVLFSDLGTRNFVLERAMQLLEEETKRLEAACIAIERNLVKSGRLKS